MYYEDIFHPNEENDVLNHQKKELNNIKSSDPGYGYIFIDKLLPSGKNRKTRVDCYSAGDSGSNIRNAETGDYYKYKVGSKDEDLFFKLRLLTDKCDEDLTTLYYDSPEQYENHFNTVISDDVKEKWKAKYADEIYKRKMADYEKKNRRL